MDRVVPDKSNALSISAKIFYKGDLHLERQGVIFMQEIWKDVCNYEGYYQISNKGRIKSLDRYVERNGKLVKVKGKILNLNKNNAGYYYLNLCTNNSRKKFLIHRLVAIAFIPNQNKLKCINHKDENKSNNSVENLEWCNHKYNSNYGNIRSKLSDKKCKSVICLELNKKFKSQTEAANYFNIKQSAISFCCNNSNRTAGGYHWQFTEG